jgi:hypothetical protein
MANIWQDMKVNHAIRGFATLVTGIIITLVLWWFFSGFSFLTLPGVAILFIGVAEILYSVYGSLTDKKSRWVHAGLLLSLIGVAGYLSLASHVMLAILMIASLAMLVIGLISFAIGIIRAVF